MAIDQSARRTFATEVRVHMLRRDATQGQLADALGLSQPSVSARLAGVTPWTLDELVAAARFLEVPVAVLLAPVDAAA